MLPVKAPAGTRDATSRKRKAGGGREEQVFDGVRAIVDELAERRAARHLGTPEVRIEPTVGVVPELVGPEVAKIGTRGREYREDLHRQRVRLEGPPSQDAVQHASAAARWRPP